MRTPSETGLHHLPHPHAGPLLLPLCPYPPSPLPTRSLSDVLMDRAVLNESNLKNALLVRAVLTQSDLGKANVEGADFTNALIDKEQQMALCRYADGTNPGA